MPVPAPLAWPYPRWIAHRGAGQLAPENTLAAFRLGLRHGYQMAECDVKRSPDGQLYLLHDDTLDRTTSATGSAARPWAELARLDAGGWHSAAFAGERLPTLAETLDFGLRHGLAFNLEIKPSPGDDAATGRAVAQAVAGLWPGTAPLPPPLLSSFSREALAAARDAQPEQTRALLLNRLAPDWADAAADLGCVAVVAHHPLWTPDLARRAADRGLRRLAYTVNDPAEAERLLALGLDGLITDRIDVFSPDA